MAIQKREYTPSMLVVMRLLKDGTLTERQAAEILGCSPKTIHNFKTELGIEGVFVGTGANRREAAEANRKRSALLETLAKQIKYEGGDLKALAEEHIIPTRTLYRWVLKV